MQSIVGKTVPVVMKLLVCAETVVIEYLCVAYR